MRQLPALSLIRSAADYKCWTIGAIRYYVDNKTGETQVSVNEQWEDGMWPDLEAARQVFEPPSPPSRPLDKE